MRFCNKLKETSYVFRSRKRMEMSFTSASAICNLIIPPESISAFETYKNEKKTDANVKVVVINHGEPDILIPGYHDDDIIS